MKRLVIALLTLLFHQAPIFAQETPWTEEVGFAPDLERFAGLEAGTLITSRNIDGLSPLVADGIVCLVRDYGLELEVSDYKPIRPSEGYVEATIRNKGQAKAIETGKSIRKRGIEGYRGGLPFPKPENGLEVMWNQYFAYRGDDGSARAKVYFVSADSGVERSEEWRFSYLFRALFRTDLEPMPHIPRFERQGVVFAALAEALSPYDKAGLRGLYFRFVEPLDQRGYLYVPSMRRPIKSVFGAPGVPWNGSDMLYEDMEGYSGYPEWCEWTILGQKSILAPMHAGPGEEAQGVEVDFDRPPHWNPRIRWEPRPVYVVEGRPKFWTSPYGRFVLYVDAETYYAPIKEGYSKDGSLRKVVIHAYDGSQEGHPPRPVLALAVDLAKERATLLLVVESQTNIGLSEAMFSPAYLFREGK